MPTNPTSIGIKFIGGLVGIGLITWFSTISDDTGNIAVAVITVLWLLWLMKNYGQINQLATKL